MKKFFIAFIIIILLLGVASYFLIFQRSSKIQSPQKETSFNTDDNLDEALQELDQLDQLE